MRKQATMETMMVTPGFLLQMTPLQRRHHKRSPIQSSSKLPSFATAISAKRSKILSNSAPKLYPSLSPQQIGGSGFAEGPGVGKKEKMIVWFRGDLRLHDHLALDYARQHASQILPIYCFDPRQFEEKECGALKTGLYRAQFLLESVDQLRRQLRKIGSDLIIREGKPEDVIVKLCLETGVRKVVYHREICFSEQELEQSLQKGLDGCKVEYKPLWSNTLYHVDDLPFDVNSMPDIYTNFRSRVRQEGKISEPLEAPERLPTLIRCEKGRMPSLNDLGNYPNPGRVSRNEGPKGGELEGLKRLQKYVQDDRSRDYPGSSLGADFSCKISPWLALGCISPRQVYHELTRKQALPELNKNTAYNDLIWRDFFRFITFKYAAVQLHGEQGVTRATQKANTRVRSGVQNQVMSAVPN